MIVFYSLILIVFLHGHLRLLRLDSSIRCHLHELASRKGFADDEKCYASFAKT